MKYKQGKVEKILPNILPYLEIKAFTKIKLIY